MQTSRTWRLCRVGLVGLVVASLATGLSPALAHPVAESFVLKAPRPVGAEGAAASWIGGKYYVTHGYVPGDSCLAHVYNPATDSWSGIATASVCRSELVGAAVGTKHYAIGGRCPGPCPVVEIYDTVTNTWSFGAPMPTGRVGLGAAVVGGKIYVVGGRTGTAPYSGVALNKLEIYDTATNTWAVGPPMPIARADVYATVALGPLVIVIGGNTAAAFTELGSIDVFDTVTNTWLTLPPIFDLPAARARSNAIAAVCDGHIYLIGGSRFAVSQTMVDRLDVGNPPWQAAPNLPITRSEIASGAVGQPSTLLGQLGPGVIQVVGSGIFGLASGVNYQFNC